MIRCDSWWAEGSPIPEVSIWRRFTKAIRQKMRETGGVNNMDVLQCLWDDEETRDLMIKYALTSVAKNDFINDFPFGGQNGSGMPISLTVITKHVLDGNSEFTNNYNSFQCIVSHRCFPIWLQSYISIIVSSHPRISNTITRLRGGAEIRGMWTRDVCGLGAAELNFFDRVQFHQALTDSLSEIAHDSDPRLCNAIIEMAEDFGICKRVNACIEKLDKSAFDKLPIREMQNKHILHYCDELESTLVAYSNRDYMERTLRQIITTEKSAMLDCGIFKAPVLSLVFNLTANWDTRLQPTCCHARE